MVKIEDLEIEDLFEELDQVEIWEIDISDILKPIWKNIYKLNSKIDRRLKLWLQGIKNNIKIPKDWKDYILTSKDKKEIADSIKVPVVEKIIEKTETIIEKPIVTNEIKEVAMYELWEQIVEKINSLPIDDDEYKIDASHIKNLPVFTWGRKYSLNWVPTWGTIWQKLVKKTNQDYDMQWIDDIDNTVVTADSTDTLTNKTLDSYTNFIHADWIHLRVKAKENLVYWDVLMFVWFNAGEQAIEVSKRDDINVPAIWVIHDTLATGEFGMAVSNGLFKNIDTSAFSQWTILYPNTSGWFTDTDPWGYAQQIAYVVKSHHINGEIMLNVWPVYWLGKRDLYTREYLVTNWSEEPALNTAITGGTVYDYVLGSVTRYRFVPTTYNPTQDAFYGAFDWTNLTSLITTRW